ncbi:PAS domain S-box protein [Roseomonas stagni]|uniref:histidine kinase n=1 Tax=Falsiroseomonas algicola TaxID=2716930 RepID=A0A6M1LFW7_9PROT|nr:PAS domain S-box protein [Falsiroseomonas algicola]NGM19140.1 PAS domain S-box protein [Falsiroseomonas algicola]
MATAFGRGDIAPAPLRRRQTRVDLLGQVAAILIPAILFAISAAHSWHATWDDAASDLRRGAQTASEYVRRILDSHALRLDRANDLLAGLDDDAIRDQEARLHGAFARIADKGPASTYHISIFAFDASGRPLVSASLYPVPRDLDLSDREFNQVLRNPAEPEPHLSSVHVGRIEPDAYFALTRRRAPSGNLPGGTYEGVLNYSIYVDDMAENLRRLALEPTDILSLVRRDGRVLARSVPPPGDPTQLRISRDGDVPAKLERSEDSFLALRASGVDGVQRLSAWQAVAGYSAHVAIARPRSAIVSRWTRSILPQGLAATGAAAALLVIGAALNRRRLAEERVAAGLAEAKIILEKRVEERTAALGEAMQRSEDAAAERVAILSQLAEGVVVADRDGRIVFINEAAARIHGTSELGVPPERYSAAYTLLTEDGRPHPPETLPMFRAVRHGEVVTDARWRVRRPDGTVVLAAGSARPLRDAAGQPNGAVLTLRDETARDEAERALAASEAEFRAIFDTAAAGVTEVDVATNRYRRVNRRFTELVGLDQAEIIDRGLGPDDVTHPDDRGINISRLAASSAEGQREGDKRYLRPDGTVIWVRISAAVAARDADGQPTRTVSMVQDITERRQAERRQALLVAELNHRVKNVLATVQAIASQTLRGSRGDPARFAEDFAGRLRVLAHAHDLLTETAWHSADLGALARAALAPWIAPDAPDRVVMRGLGGVRLDPRQGQAMVLALHELATNAVKHGGLSLPGGQVRLEAAWQGESLRLSWRESGGPPVSAPPARRGFGTRLLERGLASDLGADATVTLRFAPAGVEAEILFRPEGEAAL